ncbi:unnamed protein product [Pleuronectes platessa]|uniref:Uncharacterized protein n=1 Tax=Pleuronectes platessa TaxID=8262 RepID=A0A9N7VW73_PLEPL|nr:unnamed protein product [Pleuronectes platessa]
MERKGPERSERLKVKGHGLWTLNVRRRRFDPSSAASVCLNLLRRGGQGPLRRGCGLRLSVNHKSTQLNFARPHSHPESQDRLRHLTNED